MNKALIIGILVSGMWSDLATRSIQPAIAQSLPTVQPATGKADISKLQLIDAGAEPRRELKFRPLANSKQSMTVEMAMSMSMVMGETPIPQAPLPKVVMKIDLTVVAVEPSGDIHYKFAYSDIRAIATKDTTPETLAAMQKSFNNLKGIEGDLVMSDTGQIKRKNFVFPKSIDPTMKQTLTQFEKSMEQISTRLPSGKVGVGGKWQINNSLQTSGIQLNQAATYEIVAIDDRGMTLRSKLVQSSPPQDLDLPGKNKGAKGRINSLISNGEGRYVILFDSLLPIAGKVSIATESKMSIQNDPKESPTNITSNIGIDLNLTGK